MRVIAVVNQKGGVGKTTTAINLATAMAAMGNKVLLVDIDPQGNASTGLGVRRSERAVTIYDVLVDGASMEDAAVKTLVPGLHLIPSDVDLAGAELELSDLDGRTSRLKKALADYPVRPDYVFIDCPPSLSLLTVNALAAANSVIVPLQCEFFALEGLSQLLKTVEMIKAQINPALKVEGVLLTMYDQRNRLSGQVADDVRQHLGRAVFKTIIPRNVRVSEAPSFGKPVLLYDQTCQGSQAYIKLARELMRKHEGQKV